MSASPPVVTVVSGCAIATVDPAGTEYPFGHLVIEGTRIAAVGAGAVPAGWLDRQDRRIDGRGLLATPGLVNTHHHLYQWITRGYAQDATLFGWLNDLYPVWAGIDEDTTEAAAAANLGWLAMSGCTLTTDHHYVFPKAGGDVLGATIAGARRIGLRFHPTRGSMDLGRSSGGLPPDSVVEATEDALIASEEAINRWHDPSPDSALQIALAPCSPFSVTAELMTGAAALARRHGVRLHTHLCETMDEEAFCLEKFGRRPVDYIEDLGWLGPDVWFAHSVWPSPADIAKFAATGTSVAHCPTSNARLGSGIAPIADMLAAGVTVGLGVDGAASNESGRLDEELHQALLVARLRSGSTSMSARQVLSMATIGGATVLGRQDDLGSLEVGKLADVALWRVDTIGGGDIADPVAALVLGSRSPLELLTVGGAPVVESGELVNADAGTLGRASSAAARKLAAAAGR
ncbi:8-oxoguanine deaminase [Nakamurella sp. PAMC28650]|uniref:8-oxoguanine deaminase n=1 Tax=Nakamurella sp. PAMC28650 TaxID=2762325 RepID=UPI00164E9944|nr:8-oxoguanine deaminase [Nakamurella sp. PAMC28650]QNK80535.1 8-oxoguanine deaminase [Nakamurella sp. PAMC28650]